MTPADTQQALQLAMQHHEAGRLADAEIAYRQILARQPDHVATLQLLGMLRFQQAQHAEALELIQRAIAHSPATALLHCTQGQMLATVGRLEDSVSAYRKALDLQSDIPDAWHEMGLVLNKLNRRDEAAAAIERAIQQRPTEASFHGSLGHVLHMKGEMDCGIAAYERAIQLRPDFVEAHNDLGTALSDRAEYDLAIAHYQRALELRPDFVDAHRNLGAAMINIGRLEQAETTLRKALSLRPDDALAHVNLGYAMLLRGRLKEGWIENEWRWRATEFGLHPLQCAQPMWDGSDLDGWRILLWAEQGFGDNILAARFIAWVAQRGGKVILRIPMVLQRLMQSLKGVDQLIGEDEPLPQFDVHCPLMTLPKLFDARLNNIPVSVPYLGVEEELLSRWRKRLGNEDRRLKVGLVWAGRPKPNPGRTCPLANLAPLAQLTDVRFVSLQKREFPHASDSPPPGMELLDISSELKVFADTAAAMMDLDLILTIDTAAAHLAGALGRPVWVLLPANPDWRWLLDREDSPWYPTMRLFRQPRLGDWKSVIEQVGQRLKEFRPPIA